MTPSIATVCVSGNSRQKLEAISAAMPTPSTVDGAEFIEFAVDEADRTAFKTPLSAMGLTIAGHHRSKDVTLWRQGANCIIVNSDKEGFAHFHQINHDTLVCGLAFHGANAKDTIARAEAFLDVPHQRAIRARLT